MDPTHRIFNLTNEIVTLPTTLPFYGSLTRNQTNSESSFIVAYKTQVTFLFVNIFYSFLTICIGRFYP